MNIRHNRQIIVVELRDTVVPGGGAQLVIKNENLYSFYNLGPRDWQRWHHFISS